ncbi:Stress responsive alpha-beta barrel domain-containing protein [Spirochaeta thermophila DSM 6578]|uniref:Stress responsive alpha-beta barrel domain-containing protein n=1 Tax=Winmispira thermophila (strain ATCC 700085 / DSM 6578 / Z-1203) TaxID=869211 RepID=G0GDH1_WINT7|nr:Dabb family protein [Spirochaeta thermophila]AEJ61318.1 Stress responsive alpha-beta barrel domain-containing protein [Spirochaeta thermophila DSM 6578]
MVVHVVMWRLADASRREEVLREVRERLLSMQGRIPQVLDVEVGVQGRPDPDAYDVVLVTRHADWEGLDAYQVHPYHQEVKAFLGERLTGRCVVDYEVRA